MVPNKPTQGNKRTQARFLDTKLFIGALSAALIIGCWNLYSQDIYQAEKAAPAAVLSLPPQQPANVAQGFPPLPTLVPLISLNEDQANQLPVSASEAQTAGQSLPLRSVSIPTPQIIQKVKPIIVQPVITAGGESSQSGDSSSKPVTTTRSSK